MKEFLVLLLRPFCKLEIISKLKVTPKLVPHVYCKLTVTMNPLIEK